MVDALVTGASGFIGTRLVARLVQGGRQVRALTRRSSADIPGACEQLVGDIRDESALDHATRDVATVYHLAALTPGAAGDIRATNVEGTKLLMHACLGNRVRRIVFVSSVSVYMPPLPALIDETAPIGGFDLYGGSKAEAEAIIRGRSASQIDYVILRPCQVYGSGDRSGYTQRLTRLLSGRFVPVARGSSRFSLVHVDDVVEALEKAGDSARGSGGVYNLAGPDRTSLGELAQGIAGLSGGARRTVAVPRTALRAALSARWSVAAARRSSVRPLVRTYAAGTVYSSIWLGGPEYVTTRAQEELGFVATVDSQTGIRRLMAEQDDLASADD